MKIIKTLKKIFLIVPVGLVKTQSLIRVVDRYRKFSGSLEVIVLSRGICIHKLKFCEVERFSF